MKVPVAVSARHLHLSQKDLDALFGEGYQLTYKKELSQPGQYACNERVEVIGPKGSLTMTILAPLRSDTQVEMSVTDARKIGIEVFARDSGDIKGSAGAKLKGPAGEIDIKEGVIIAKRHIHMSPAEAESIGIKDKDHVDVLIEGEDQRSLVLKHVLIRTNPDFSADMHIDTDEGNAAGVYNGGFGTIIVNK